MNERSIWVKSFQRRDIQLLGKSQKYGNSAYRLNTTLEFHDTLSMTRIDIAIHNNVPTNVIAAGVQGEWHVLTMECKVEELDGGEWIASEYKFSPSPNKPDFPFEKVKGN